jgi:hypothetical protein
VIGHQQINLLSGAGGVPLDFCHDAFFSGCHQGLIKSGTAEPILSQVPDQPLQTP